MVGSGGSSAAALPGIEADVMMIATRRYKGCLVAEPQDLVESEHTRIKRERAIDVGHFQVHMADACAGGDLILLHERDYAFDVNEERRRKNE